MPVEAKGTSHMIARRRAWAKGEPKDTRVQAKVPQAHVMDVEETIGEASALKEEPAKEERQEVERLAMGKEDMARAKARGSTTWGSRAQRKTLGQDHPG